MALSLLYSLTLLATFLSLSPLVASDDPPGMNATPDVPLCNVTFDKVFENCTLGINLWYNIPDGPGQPASTGEYGGASINEVIFFDTWCRPLFTLLPFSPQTEDDVGTLSPPGLPPLTIQGNDEGADRPPFHLTPNAKLESGFLPSFTFTFNGTQYKQDPSFRPDGGCAADSCSCNVKLCKRKEKDIEYSGMCCQCPFTCINPHL